MLGAGAAELQATIKLELDWVKCPAISGISHCQVIKWDQDTCSSASVRAVAWILGSGVLISSLVMASSRR